MKNAFIKTTSIIISILIIMSLGIGTLTTNAEETNNNEIHINRMYLKAGESLRVYNPSNYTLKYFIDNKEVEGDTLDLVSDYYEKWITVKAYKDGEFVTEDKAYFSKLPVIYINTADGNGITSKDEYKKADMSIQNNEVSNKEIYAGEIDIKGRGNTTWSVYPKKPYKIKLSNKTDLFGMGKSKHWVLLANYIDPCFMRNVNASRLSHELGIETMDFVWTDLILNGKYVGNYLLGEQVRIGSTRVDIADWEEEAENVASAVNKAEKANGVKIDKDALENILKNNLNWITRGWFTYNDKQYVVDDYYKYDKDISGGYLFELSDEFDELSEFTTNGGLKVMLKSPEYLFSNAVMNNNVVKLWNNFEKAYKSETGYVKIDGKNVHYTQIADLDSMVGYWLVIEILGNNDAVYKSRFAYKDKGQLLKFGPTWDFDYGCGSIPVGDYPNGWKVTANVQDNAKDANCFKEFVDDPLFIARATELYWQVRPYLQSLIDDGGTIDKDTEYLTESGLADSSLWDRSYIYGNRARNFTEDATSYKTFIKNRIRWLDERFKTDETLLNSVHINDSASPYVNAKDKISVTFTNSRNDTTEKAPADGLISSNDKSLNANIDVTDNETSEIKVFVNGIYTNTLSVTDGKAELSIAKDKLNYPCEQKNVISLVGKDEIGDTTNRTFKTVKVTYEEPKETEPISTQNITVQPTEQSSTAMATDNTESTSTVVKATTDTNTEPISTMQSIVTENTETITSVSATNKEKETQEPTTYNANTSFASTTTDSEKDNIETTLPLSERPYRFIPSKEQYKKGYNFKLLVQDTDNQLTVYNFEETNIKLRGIPILAAFVPDNITPVVLQYQVFDGDNWINQIEKSGEEAVACENEIVEGYAETEEETTKAEETSGVFLDTQPTSESGSKTPEITTQTASTAPLTDNNITETTTQKGSTEATEPTTKVFIKKDNTLKVTKKKAKSLKAKILKFKKQKIQLLKIANAKGTVKVIKLKKGTTKKIYKKIKINSKNGTITFKKGKYPKKKYTIKFKITAYGNSVYRPKTVIKAVKIKMS